ncbi:uncharacterized protein PITG_14950 [Phytophthora infestans T30-4]|uniref:Uncharacterized protein n=1 Tax=Phytophthora infestans (strain T30-4) TaxID=403677 RepID=D0NPE2_PHYIT|nr:uncharacterized protein PITG_14950 [Phytophthora infestans T30-4]EEY62484.1 conserved hypothetical protein [Phytophthora infestans T30-4]|eukprot:XP_002899120.1 conserved hypothetical protein [Phytophthora infestans T30-4]
MFAFYDEVPTSTSLLMQCEYRSKVCTNHRATNHDGTLHKLCEFHRQKANLNQQRLLRRQREKRVHMDILELLLIDMQPQTLPLLDAYLSSSAVDDKGSITV